MGFEKIGNILLLDRIAAGGMAEVFRAKQFGSSGFEKTLAVKKILPNFSANAEFRSMFRAEANLSALLQHPNIVHIYSNGEEVDYLYLVMEFIEGKTLKELLDKNKSLGQELPIDLCCFIMSETAKGLDYAHNFREEENNKPLNIVHRDINHQNIILSVQGGVKILDFGVAKAAATTKETRAGVLKGKIAYMSPEQAHGKPVDQRTDIFALGIVLWETTTGQPLFMTSDELGTLENVRSCVVRPPSEINAGIPEELERIIMKCLQKDVFSRYQSAKEVLIDLQRFMNQNYSTYTPMDAASYLNELFAEEFSQKRIARTKINEEAREFVLQSAKHEKPNKSDSFSDDERETTALSKRTTNNNIIQFAPPTAEQTEAARLKIDLGGGAMPPSFSSLPSITIEPAKRISPKLPELSDRNYLLYAAAGFVVLAFAAILYYIFG